MARFTSLEFLEALGLSYGDYNGAKILLRLLQKKGIAKEVGKISPTGRGRKMVVYELPEEISLGVVKPPDSVPSHPIRKKKPKVEETPEDEVVADHDEDEIFSEIIHQVDEDSDEVEVSADEESYEDVEALAEEEELVEASLYEWGDDDE